MELAKHQIRQQETLFQQKDLSREFYLLLSVLLFSFSVFHLSRFGPNNKALHLNAVRKSGISVHKVWLTVVHLGLVLNLIPAPAVAGALNGDQVAKQQQLDGLGRHFGENPKPALVHLGEIITPEERPGKCIAKCSWWWSQCC